MLRGRFSETPAVGRSEEMAILRRPDGDRAADAPVLEVRGMSKRFGAVQALADVSLHLSHGEILGLLGDNGAGKSTLVKCLAGSIVPDSGRVLIEGEPVRLANPEAAQRHGIETIFQDLGLVDVLNVTENVFLNRELPSRWPLLRELGWIDKKRMHARMRDVLIELGISIPSVRVPVAHLSGGQRQIVAVTRGVMWGRRILLMDEPAAALGVVQARVVRNLVQRLTERGVSIVYISHNMQEVVELCHRAVVLRHGRKIADLEIEGVTARDLVDLITGASADANDGQRSTRKERLMTPQIVGGRPLAERAGAVIPGGVNSGQRRVAGLEGLVIVETGGATITDERGNVYVDFHAAFGPPLLGRNDEDVDRAVHDTARKIDLPGVGVTPQEIALAEQLVELVPSIERVLLTLSGSEATFHALRVAKVATGRQRIIKFQGCYHGWHDAVAMNVITPAELVGGKAPLSQGIHPAVLDATIVVPFNDLAAVEQAFRDHPDEIAAVIVEPIAHNIGAVLPKDGFLEGLRELCTRHGAVLIFDEIITGFRHGLGGYQAIAGVTPDLTTLGKAMANGYPLSALGGRRELMDLFSTRSDRPAFFAGTFNGHPAMAAAALATIAKLREEPVHEHVFRLGQCAREGLAELFRRLELDAVVSGFGSVFVTYFMRPPVERYDDLLRNDVELFTGYRVEALRHGVFELPLNLKRSHFSYRHTDEHVDLLLEATEKAVTTLLERRRTGGDTE